LHHVVLERWSRGKSILHRRDPRAKIIALLVFLLAVATTPPSAALYMPFYAAIPLAALLIARLPLGGVLRRAAVVLPFCAVFALMSAAAGDAGRAVALVEKSYLSALAVLAVAGTTPVPLVISGLGSLGAPRYLLLVIQFLYRYLFVISEQAQHMRLAARSRASAGGFRFRRWRLRAATGALTVLFARSYLRAQGTYRAMLARSFEGRVHLLSTPKFAGGDIALVVLGILVTLALRVAVGLLA
jgi:cobalt/nickel transport system permease protein